MNPTNHANPPGGHVPPSGLSLDDVYFTLFRHKWLLLGFFCLGIAAAAAVRVLRPPLYVSKAEVMVHYVVDTTRVTAPKSDDSIMPTDPGGQGILNSEQEILKSLDLATNVADLVGPAKILARRGGGTNRMAAAGVVCSGIEVEIPPRTTILSISFKHPDPQVVQPVLSTLIQMFQRMNMSVWERGVRDGYYAQQLADLSSNIAVTDTALKKLQTEANLLFVDDAKRSYQSQISKTQDELREAQIKLLERKEVLGDGVTTPLGHTNHATNVVVPPDTIASYGDIAADLEVLKNDEREYLFKGYKEAHPLRQNVRERIEVLQKQKSDLEHQFPALLHLTQGAGRHGTNAVGTDFSAGVNEIDRLTATVGALGTVLSNLHVEATHVMEVEPEILRLQRQREEDQRNYDSILSKLNLASQASGINMSVVQSPTPPQIDYKKLFKLVGAAFGGCVGLGLGLAFLFDLIIDRTIRRSTDIERHLRLPVFIAIPDTSWHKRLWLPWRRERAGAPTPVPADPDGAGSMALTIHSGEHHLQAFTEGLRERLMTYFEVQNMNTKKPKLVAVTGCSHGAGVTTLASGLAAELSKTGDGNVLLVDMTAGDGAAHPFYQGKPGRGLADVLEPEGRAEAQVDEKLYVASLQDNGNDKLTKMPPNRFAHLVPKLKASDYDYIIFDMPPVSATSPTPRLASHMDIVLLVLESEKTGQQLAARATALMRDARANVATVLNRCREHVPARLSQGF